jgi:bifunctional non-homologous end joining protein LigD
VKPVLVAEVKFTGWTHDGALRHPVFVAFRSDKPAAQVVRELPVNPKKLEAIMKSGHKTRRAASAPTKKTQTENDSTAGVTVTHPDKILYPDTGTTKRDLAEYYTRVQQWMLPHCTERPLALVRCPGGLASKCFFQRNWSDTLPAAIDKVDVGEGKAHDFHVSIHNLSGIISLAQIGVLELHTWNCRNDNVERPDQLVFDLDPGPGLAWKRVVEAARALNRMLQSLHLPTFLKTSGGKGLHLTIPIEPNIDWDSAKSFCATIAKALAEKSELFVANMRKDLRGGKVYVDYNRNGRSATAVAPYSTRARAGAAIAMPISWDELGKLKSADQFNVATVGRYLDKRTKDPWRDFEKSRVDLHKVISHKSAA